MKPIRLRPHHFMCILTYAGAGYTKRFVKGFDAVAREIKRGRPVTLIAGPDDICAGLVGRRRARHCFSDDVKTRDRGARRDFRKRAPELFTTVTLTPARIARMRRLYRSNAIRTGCAACGWKKFCDSLVAKDFAGCKI